MKKPAAKQTETQADGTRKDWQPVESISNLQPCMCNISHRAQNRGHTKFHNSNCNASGRWATVGHRLI